RALNLEEEGAHRVVHPGDLQLAAGEGAGVDRLAVRKREKLALHVQPGDALPLERVAEAAEIDHHQIRRTGVERHGVLAVPRAAPLKEGLVVAGEETDRDAWIERGPRPEVGLEEPPRRRAVARRHLGRRVAGRLPVARTGGENPAGPQEHRHRLLQRVRLPSRQILERRRLEDQPLPRWISLEPSWERLRPPPSDQPDPQTQSCQDECDEDEKDYGGTARHGESLSLMGSPPSSERQTPAVRNV